MDRSPDISFARSKILHTLFKFSLGNQMSQTGSKIKILGQQKIEDDRSDDKEDQCSHGKANIRFGLNGAGKYKSAINQKGPASLRGPLKFSNASFLSQRRFRLIDNRAKRFWFSHGQIGQNFAIQGETGFRILTLSSTCATRTSFGFTFP
jgi:hypothetical protein